MLAAPSPPQHTPSQPRSCTRASQLFFCSLMSNTMFFLLPNIMHNARRTKTQIQHNAAAHTKPDKAGYQVSQIVKDGQNTGRSKLGEVKLGKLLEPMLFFGPWAVLDSSPPRHGRRGQKGQSNAMQSPCSRQSPPRHGGRDPCKESQPHAE